MCDSGRCELARAQNDYVTLSISDDDQEISVIVLLAALPGRLSMLTIGVPIFDLETHRRLPAASLGLCFANRAVRNRLFQFERIRSTRVALPTTSSRTSSVHEIERLSAPECKGQCAPYLLKLFSQASSARDLRVPISLTRPGLEFANLTNTKGGSAFDRMRISSTMFHELVS
jgi:hypothetical protein